MEISKRIDEINHRILTSMYPIYDFRRIYVKRFNATESEQVRAYAVIPKKRGEWESIVEKFYAILSSIKGEDESVGVDGYTFYLKGNGYKFLYQIEFWGKRAEMVGYIKNSKPTKAPLYRLNSYFAGMKFAKMSGDQREKVYDRIDVYATEVPSLNAYDRFVYAIYDVEGKEKTERERKDVAGENVTKINKIKLVDGVNKIIANDDVIAFYSSCDEEFVYEFEGEWINTTTGKKVHGKTSIILKGNVFETFEKV